MKKKITFIHFQAIELYPPFINLVNYINNNKPDSFDINIITNFNDSVDNYIDFPNVKIYRITVFRSNYRILNILNYIRFIIVSMFLLIKTNPNILFYYEELSSLPAIIYKKVLRKNASIFIHFHEYVYSLNRKMIINKVVHYFERYIYKDAFWISHTNDARLNMFKNDNNLLNKKNLYTMPNYPPISWQNNTRPIRQGQKVKIIYVGSIDFSNCYVNEFCGWISKYQSQFEFDIYSLSISSQLNDYISNFENINYKGSIEYSQLNIILQKYQVGVILYNPTSLNYIYNAPNKLFEYLACNLDVWYPKTMKGIKEYATSKTYPRVLELDFNNLLRYNPQKLIQHHNLTYSSSKYFDKEVYSIVLDKMIKV